MSIIFILVLLCACAACFYGQQQGGNATVVQGVPAGGGPAGLNAVHPV